MALGAGSEIEISFIDQGVKWLFLKVWGKTVKTIKPQRAKRKFTLKFIYKLLMPSSVSNQFFFIIQSSQAKKRNI
ncbi:hypothetical protein Hanom_Chr08g00719341 [Helianthus anomalus]